MKPVPAAGLLTVIVPVEVVQSTGDVADAVGATGASGGSFTTTVVAEEIQPAAFCTVTL